MMNLKSERNQITDALNRPLSDLRISLTDRCNLKCHYCVPSVRETLLPRENILSFEEIVRAVDIITGLGVSKIKLTGGEPLMRQNIDRLISNLKKNPRVKDMGLITNGILLKTRAVALKNAGLTRISVSLDAINNSVFQTITGNTGDSASVIDGIEAARRAGFFPIKINCVVQRGMNEDEILPLVEHFRKPGFHLRFIEFMDVGKIDWDKEKVVPSKEILTLIQSHYSLVPVEASYYGEVATRYAHKKGQGEIGFITSVTKPFCHSCTRLRISSDGKLYKCLFNSENMDIKSLLRSQMDDASIQDKIAQFWLARNDRYSEQRQLLHNEQNRESMQFIGG